MNRLGLLALLLPLFLVACSRTGTVLPEAYVETHVSPNVVISQVYGGGGNSGAPYTHDFIELFNRGGASVSLDGWSLQYASATGTGNFGASSGQLTELPNVTLQPGQYYLVQQAAGAGNGAPLPTPDLVDSTPIAMAAVAGKVALAQGTTSLGCNGGSTACSTEQLARIIDLVGYGNANFFEGAGAAPTLTNTTAAMRASSGCTDTDDNAVDFAAGAPAPRNTATPLNLCAAGAPRVASTNPADGATDVLLDASITITFSEAVDVGDDWYGIVCATSGDVEAVVAGGPVVFTLWPAADFAGGEACTVTVVASHVTSADDDSRGMAANHVFEFTTASLGNACELPFTPIYAIQGSGMTTPFAGQTVTTQGVVIGDYEGPAPALRGFYIQDPSGDGNLATSDGVFVFNGGGHDVSLGDVVRVTGTAAEFQDQTQIASVTRIDACGTGSVEPVDIALPFVSADYLERYEGMLVRLPQTLVVTEHFQLGRFGQVVLTSGERLRQPTNVVAPGAAANAMQADNDLDRIILDDGLNNQNPDPIVFGRGGAPLSASNTLRGGDHASDIVGVLTYTWAGNAASGNAYRVRPIGALGGSVNFEAANLRPAEPPVVDGNLRVGSFNVLNYFNTFTGCTNGVGGGPIDCRGANNQAEFERQAAKIVTAILRLDVDVLGLIEIENDGYGPASAIAELTDRLNVVEGPGTWAFVDVDAATGQVDALGTDAIKVGFLYRPAAVTPIGDTAVLNTLSFVTGGDSSPRNRPALAQAFADGAGGAFVAVVNHLKSKGGACEVPDAGDGQGNCNEVRTRAAQELAAWLATDPTGTADPDVLVLGDLNAYAQEDPITALRNAGFVDLLADRLGAAAYTYVFDGQWGSLDHALASPTLDPQVTGVGVWHINADEPTVLDYNTEFKSAGQITNLYASDAFRSSDHDPVLVGLDLRPSPTCAAAAPSTTHLWPVNHKLLAVSIHGVEPVGGAVSIVVTSVFQDEPVDAPGDADGATRPDAAGIGTSTAWLRAERDETGNGRVYHVSFRATDTAGQVCDGVVQVKVAANQGRFGAAIDDGPLYDSTAN
jgi:uncharacterized protein